MEKKVIVEPLEGLDGRVPLPKFIMSRKSNEDLIKPKRFEKDPAYKSCYSKSTDMSVHETASGSSLTCRNRRIVMYPVRSSSQGSIVLDGGTSENPRHLLRRRRLIPKNLFKYHGGLSETHSSNGTSPYRRVLTNADQGNSRSGWVTQKQQSIRILRQNMTALYVDSKRTVAAPPSAVPHVLEPNIPDVNDLQVLEAMDDRYIYLIVKKTMELCDKMYGEALAEELKKHLGVEKYTEIANRGAITTYAEFLAKRHHELNKENRRPSVYDAQKIVPPRVKEEPFDDEDQKLFAMTTVKLDPEPKFNPKGDFKFPINVGKYEIDASVVSECEDSLHDIIVSEKSDGFHEQDSSTNSLENIFTSGEMIAGPPEKLFEDTTALSSQQDLNPSNLSQTEVEEQNMPAVDTDTPSNIYQHKLEVVKKIDGHFEISLDELSEAESACAKSTPETYQNELNLDVNSSTVGESPEELAADLTESVSSRKPMESIGGNSVDGLKYEEMEPKDEDESKGPGNTPFKIDDKENDVPSNAANNIEVNDSSTSKEEPKQDDIFRTTFVFVDVNDSSSSKEEFKQDDVFRTSTVSTSEIEKANIETSNSLDSCTIETECEKPVQNSDVIENSSQSIPFLDAKDELEIKEDRELGKDMPAPDPTESDLLITEEDKAERTMATEHFEAGHGEDLIGGDPSAEEKEVSIDDCSLEQWEKEIGQYGAESSAKTDLSGKKGSCSPDLETSMNDLAELLISLQATGPISSRKVNNYSNESFEKFARDTVKTMKIDHDYATTQPSTSTSTCAEENTAFRESVEPSVDDAAQMLMDLQKSSFERVPENNVDDDCILVEPVDKKLNESETRPEDITAEVGDLIKTTVENRSFPKPARDASTEEVIVIDVEEDGPVCDKAGADEDCVLVDADDVSPPLIESRKELQERREMLRKKVKSLSKTIQKRIKTVRRTYEQFGMLVSLMNMNRGRAAAVSVKTLQNKIRHLNTINQLIGRTMISFKNTDVKALTDSLEKTRLASARAKNSSTVKKRKAKPEKRLKVRNVGDRKPVKSSKTKANLSHKPQVFHTPKKDIFKGESSLKTNQVNGEKPHLPVTSNNTDLDQEDDCTNSTLSPETMVRCVVYKESFLGMRDVRRGLITNLGMDLQFSIDKPENSREGDALQQRLNSTNKKEQTTPVERSRKRKLSTPEKPESTPVVKRKRRNASSIPEVVQHTYFLRSRRSI